MKLAEKTLRIMREEYEMKLYLTSVSGGHPKQIAKLTADCVKSEELVCRRWSGKQKLYEEVVNILEDALPGKFLTKQELLHALKNLEKRSVVSGNVN